METEKEMIDRAINEAKFAVKKNLKWIILVLVVLVIVYVFLKYIS